MLFFAVYALDQGIFKYHPAACLIDVVAASFQNVGNRIGIGYRHQLPADVVVWRVQRNRKRDGQLFLRKIVHLRYQPAGRQGHVPEGHIEPIFSVQTSQKAHRLFVIVERFPAAHESASAYT